MNISSKNVDSFSVKILLDKLQDVLFNVLCRPQNSLPAPFKNFRKNDFTNTKSA